MVIFMVMIRRFRLSGRLSVTLCLAMLGATGSASAQDDRHGFYVGIETGVSIASTVTSSLSGVNHPTRCDRLLYPASVSPPTSDPACVNNIAQQLTSNEFEAGAGFVSSLSFGYMAGKLRFEVEYLNRYHGNDTAALGATSNVSLQGKNTEWSSEEPPYEGIRDYNAHQLFANAYYDFVNDSRWTPYAGAGIGWARTSLRYFNRFVRKPDAEYLQIAFDPDWPDEAKRAAAGTVSFIDMPVRQNVFGVQLMTGIDYALTDRASVGAKARWATFGSLSKEATFNLIRSHAPVQADGVTPFDSNLEFGGLAYYTVTVNLKCRL
jgi:opacity protein-like surface antigen